MIFFFDNWFILNFFLLLYFWFRFYDQIFFYFCITSGFLCMFCSFLKYLLLLNFAFRFSFNQRLNFKLILLQTIWRIFNKIFGFLLFKSFCTYFGTKFYFAFSIKMNILIKINLTLLIDFLNIK